MSRFVYGYFGNFWAFTFYEKRSCESTSQNVSNLMDIFKNIFLIMNVRLENAKITLVHLEVAEVESTMKKRLIPFYNIRNIRF